MDRIDAYEFRISWNKEDEVFVARVTEFPSLATHGDTREEALREMKELLVFVLEDLESEGEKIPEPVGSRDFSGRFNVRIPQSLHRQLVLEAEREGVSLNQLANWKLAR